MNHHTVRTGPHNRLLNLWFLLAFFLCAGASLLVVDGLLISHLLNVHLGAVCTAAQSAYRRGGAPQLAALLEGVEMGRGMRPHLLDATGRDLVSGQDRSVSLTEARQSRVFVPFQRLEILKTAEYTCVIEPPVQAPRFPLGPMLWMLPFLSILCCTVGAYVSWRMRRIEEAVHNFGSGQLAVRTTSGSGDSIGRLARAFNEMAERIESLVGAHQRLCADVAHELRSPASRLLMAISMARRGSPVALDRIELEAGRMNDLINQLLEVARAEVDPATLDLELVDLRSLLTEIADYCGFEASQRDCHVDLTFFQPGSVLADSEILRRAIENVLRNAIHHGPAGGRIELSAVGDDESVLVSICDQGIGVPDEALEEIFQPFFRVATVTNRNANGAGLGLAIAQRAIGIHRGTIRAENRAPGLRVEIELPRK